MAHLILRIPETKKLPGVHYALTNDGIELPVLDLTHAAFRFDPSDAELRARVADFVRDSRRRERLPKVLSALVLKIVLRGSVLAQGLRDAEGAFLSGVHTYLFKLGPELLGSGWARPVDRRIVDSLPARSMRLRLFDMADLLAEGMTAPLVARRTPLHFVNIGGGPASDSWNAVLLLRSRSPDLLENRPVYLHVLDRDEAGASFGARAVAALTAQGGPLAGLDVTFAHIPYDWARPRELPAVLRELDQDGEPPVVAVSSEGALFDYGSDAEITSNLEALHALTPPDAVMVGSVTGDDEVGMLVLKDSTIRVRPRSAEAFAALADAARWRIVRTIQRPTCRDVALAKAVS
jgi:hypothetical protein